MDAMERLLTLGLSQNEARLYAALLLVKTAKVSELVKLAKIHRTNVYAALDRLVERGIISGNEGKVGIFTASPPETVFADTLEGTESLLRVQRESIKELERAYERRASGDRPIPSIEVKRVAPGELSAGLWDRIRCVEKARKEILFLSAGPAMPQPRRTRKSSMDRLDRAEVEALKRGVRCRCVLQASFLDDPRVLQRERKLIRAGEEARVVDRLPTNLSVVDRRTAWFASSSVLEHGVCYKVNDPLLGELFAQAFEYNWEQGVDALEYMGRSDRPSAGTRRHVHHQEMPDRPRPGHDRPGPRIRRHSRPCPDAGPQQLRGS